LLNGLNSLNRVASGLRTWPGSATWRYCCGIGAIYAACAWSFGFVIDLYVYNPRIDLDLAQVALIAFFVPAIGEEVFFRAALTPTHAEKPSAWSQMAFALIAFLAWHPLNAALFFNDVLPLFSDWRFLTVTALLGLTCAHLWRKTGSLWPPILVHWVAVVIWKGFLGGPHMM
jgi:uncharacterized protein